MAGVTMRKRKRGNTTLSVSSVNGAMDLFVPIPVTGDSPTKTMERILIRLQETGYKCIAITHIVHGLPNSSKDRANFIISDEAIKKFKAILNNKITLLRRLHVIIENISDMKLFSPQSVSEHKLLTEYDLLSIAPRNERVFQAACTCDGIDIVTLDGSTSTSNVLPFTIRSTDIQAIRNRNAMLEIPYAIPILNRTARKGWIQTCRSIITSSLGGNTSSPLTTKVPVIFSSGIRSALGPNSNTQLQRQADVGPFALRTADDLVNVIHALLTFDHKTAKQSVTSSAQVAKDHGKKRRTRLNPLIDGNKVDLTKPRSSISIVAIDVGKMIRPTIQSSTAPVQSTDGTCVESKDSSISVHVNMDNNDDKDDTDGFIAL